MTRPPTAPHSEAGGAPPGQTRPAAGFQGGIRLVAPLARPDERAGVLSVLYLVSYLGLGSPPSPPGSPW